MDRERHTPGSPSAGSGVARALIDVGVGVMAVLSLVAFVAGAVFGSFALLGPWCDASPAECRMTTQDAESRRFGVLLGVVLLLATTVLPILFARATRSLHDAPWAVAGRLLGCLAGYLVPVVVILLASR
jgi:hypothetical protein